MTDQNENHSVAQADSSASATPGQAAQGKKKPKLAIIIIVLLALLVAVALVATITAVLQSRSVSELFLIASIVVIAAFIVGRVEGSVRPKQISSKALKGLTRGLFGIVNLCLLALTASIAIVGLKQQDSAALTPVFSISAEQQNSSTLYQQACAWLQHFPSDTCQVTETTVLETLEPLPISETPAETESQVPAVDNSLVPLPSAIEEPNTAPTETHEASTTQEAEAEVTKAETEAEPSAVDTEPSSDELTDTQTAPESSGDANAEPSEQPQTIQP